MAFTPWKTWSVGETLTAANFNQQIRDNGLAEGPHLIVRKTADESDATGTVQNDDSLLMAIAANEVWHYKFSLRVVSASTTDFQCRLTFPVGGDLAGYAMGVNAQVFYGQDLGATVSPSPSATINTASSVTNYVTIEGVFANAGTAGNLQLQWSGNAAVACVVKANSTLWAVKLA